MELWGAEYQETNAILVREKDATLLQQMCDREKCPVSFVGDITGDGKVGNGIVRCVIGRSVQCHL